MPLIQPTSEWLSCHSVMKVGISAWKLMVPAMARISPAHSATTMERPEAILPAARPRRSGHPAGARMQRHRPAHRRVERRDRDLASGAGDVVAAPPEQRLHGASEGSRRARTSGPGAGVVKRARRGTAGAVSGNSGGKPLFVGRL